MNHNCQTSGIPFFNSIIVEDYRFAILVYFTKRFHCDAATRKFNSRILGHKRNLTRAHTGAHASTNARTLSRTLIYDAHEPLHTVPVNMGIRVFLRLSMPGCTALCIHDSNAWCMLRRCIELVSPF